MSSLIVPRADKKPSGVAPPAALLALSLREFFGSALPRLALLSRLSARGTASFGTRGEAADDAPSAARRGVAEPVVDGRRGDSGRPLACGGRG